MSDTLWCINIIGPDDVIPAPSYREAARRSLEINEHILKGLRKDLLESENMPWVWARPIEWPWSPESHAESLAKNPEMLT